MRWFDRMEMSSAWVGRKRWVLSILGVVGLVLCLPRLGLGKEVNVVFDQALTNGTGWVYGPQIFFNKAVEPYIRAKDGGLVISPEFDFAVTSVVIVLKNTTETEKGRQTWFSPVVDGVVMTNSVWTRVVRASGEKEEVRVEWAREAGVRAFSFYSGTGRGNTYFYKAKVMGAGVAESPKECRVEEKEGTRFVATWKNGEGIVSNRVDVMKVEEHPFEAEYVTNFTFDAVVNDGKAIKNLDVEKLGAAFDGWVLRVPSNSVGIVQIGASTNAGGIVVRPEIGSYEGISLVVRARRYPNNEEGKLMPVQWVVGGVTNEIVRVELGDEMKEYVVGLDGVDAGAAILVRSMVKVVSGKGDVYEGSNRRVLIDAIGFAQEVKEAYAVTNVVTRQFCCGRERMRIGKLERETKYLWTVKAYNKAGEDSADVGWMEVETTDGPPPPFVFRVQ